jgi:SAM-dependent methyltransferase
VEGAVGEPVSGWCPICCSEVMFAASTPGWRESLACSGCSTSGGSLPRERAVAWTLDLVRPDWRSLRVHEFAPAGGAFSRWLARECRAYTASHWDPSAPQGLVVRGLPNEDIHALTYGDECFDIALSLDVLEHITSPDVALAEVSRVLRPGGMHIFTTPTYPHPETVRTARDLPDGTVEIFGEPEYHGSPNDPSGSLVYHRFGLDLLSCVRQWSGRDCAVLRFDAPGVGVAGYFTEVYVNGDLARRAPDADSAPRRRWWAR